MPLSLKIREEALVACARHCCLCHKFCGTKIEVHHIRLESENGDNTFSNVIPLCFDCHADMTSYDSLHPKGTKYSESELKKHRDNWYKRVQNTGCLVGIQEVKETDIKVYNTLTGILTWNGSILFARHNNFAGFVFKMECLDDFYKFIHECENPSFEFLDTDIEGLRILLCEHVEIFLNNIALKTYPAHNNDHIRLNSVPGDWEIDKPEIFWESVDVLHKTAKDVCATYDSLIKLATRKLGVLPSKDTSENNN